MIAVLDMNHAVVLYSGSVKVCVLTIAVNGFQIVG
jgi:hypothetical protein